MKNNYLKLIFVIILMFFIYKINSQNSNLYSEIDVSKLPNLNLLTFGIEPPFLIPDSKGKKIVYDEINRRILVINFFSPNESVKLIAKEPNGMTFIKEYKISEKSFFELEKDPMTGKQLEKPILFFSFNNQSCFNEGEWEITVIIDNSDKKTIINKLNIPLISPSILNNEKINPFDNPEFSTKFSDNDLMYIYGYGEKANKNIIVALYWDSNKLNKNNEKILIPIIGFNIKTEEKGRFKIKYVVTEKFPEGYYNTAIDEKIKEVVAFNGHFSVKSKDKLVSLFFIPIVDNLRLRESAGQSGKFIRSLIKGEKLELIEKSKSETINGIKGTWIKVKTEKDEVGWCFDGYLEEIK